MWEYDLNKSEPDAVTTIADPKTVLTAERNDAHQFYDERESWYNGMRPNGFPRHHHGGKVWIYTPFQPLIYGLTYLADSIRFFGLINLSELFTNTFLQFKIQT